MKAQYGEERTRICYEEDDLKQVVAKGVEGNPLRRREKDEDGRQHPHDRGYHAGYPLHLTTFDATPTPPCWTSFYQ